MKKMRIVDFIVTFNLVITPLVFFPNQSVFDYYYIPKHMVLTIMSLFYVYHIWQSRKKLNELIKFDRSTIALLVYFSLITISVFFALNPKMAIEGNWLRHEGLATIFMYILMFFAAKSSSINYEAVFRNMLISSSIIALYGIFQFYGFDIFRRDYYRGGYIAHSTIGNPNFLGTYLTLMIPFSVHFWIKLRKKFSLFVYILLLYCSLATMSRGPWLGIIAALSIYLLIYSRTDSSVFKTQLVKFTIVTITVIAVFSLLSDRSIISRLLLLFYDLKNIVLDSSTSSGAGSYRWFIWEKVVIFIRERPVFGYGISNLEIIFESRFHNEIIRVFGSTLMIDEAHNEFLDIAVSSGIPSLVAYIYFIFVTAFRKFRFTAFSNDFYAPVFSAVVGYLVQSFFNISVVSVAYLLWIFLGILSSQNRESLE